MKDDDKNDVTHFHNALVRNSQQLIELSDTLKRQQEFFNELRNDYEIRIRELEEEVKNLKAQNNELTTQILSQAENLKDYFILKCYSQEKDVQLNQQSKLINALREQLSVCNHNIEELESRLNSGREEIVDDMEAQSLRDELETMGIAYRRCESQLNKSERMYKGEINKLKIELESALKSNEQLINYCYLLSTSISPGDETRSDVDIYNDIKKISQIHPSFIRALENSNTRETR